MAFQAARLDGTSWRGGCTPVLTGGREAGEKRKDSWEKQCILSMMFRHVSHVFLFLFSGLCGAVVNAQDQIIPRPVSVRVEAKGAATPVKLDEGMRIVCKEKDGEFRRQAHLLQQFLSRGTGLALESIIERAETLLQRELPLAPEARATLIELADGDGRYLINLMESVFDLCKPDEMLGSDALLKIVQQRAPVYDKDREGHYNLISALHKSLRGSDTDAALYWAARMLEGGEDPLYLLRRLTRFAMEDISLADPAALQMAIAAWDTYERLGSPEGELAIAELIIYLGCAPKSNSAYTAWGAARKAAREYGSLMPPAHILNAPTKLMKELGYGKNYAYDHDAPDAFSGQNYFPDNMPRRRFYRPPERGFEREINKRLAYWDKLRRQRTEEDAGNSGTRSNRKKPPVPEKREPS